VTAQATDMLELFLEGAAEECLGMIEYDAVEGCFADWGGPGPTSLKGKSAGLVSLVILVELARG